MRGVVEDDVNTTHRTPQEARVRWMSVVRYSLSLVVGLAHNAPSACACVQASCGSVVAQWLRRSPASELYLSHSIRATQANGEKE